MKDYLWCDKFQHNRSILACPACPYYPCRQILPFVDELNKSPMFDKEVVGTTKVGKRKMIGVTKNGELKDFKSATFDFVRVFDVQEIAADVKLTIKTKEERKELRNGMYYSE